MKQHAGIALDQRSGALHRVGRTGRHAGQRAVLGPEFQTGDRAIDIIDADGLQNLGVFRRRSRPDGTSIDHDTAGVTGLGKL